MVENRAKVALRLIKEQWDFFMVHFFASDLAQHSLWKFMDRTSPYYQEKEELKDGIYEIYQLIDDKIGEILKNINLKNTTIFIISDHGFGPNHKDININTILKNRGYIVTKELRAKMLIENILKNIKNSPNPIKQKVRKFVPIFEKILDNIELKGLLEKGTLKAIKRIHLLHNWSGIDSFHFFNIIDWNKTKAFSIGTMGLIYLNRDILTMDEYHKIKREIMTILKDLRDENNHKLIDEVFDVGYKTTHLGPAPDVIPLCETWPCYFNPRLNLKKEVEDIDPTRSGNHRLNGIFIAYGNHIKKASIPEKPRIIDLAPTILYLMNIPLPKMDGRVIKEIIEEEFQKEHADEKIKSKEAEKINIAYTILRIRKKLDVK